MHIVFLVLFLAPILSDLTFIDENPTRVDGCVNFIKCHLVCIFVCEHLCTSSMNLTDGYL